jgi:hypothetical protein
MNKHIQINNTEYMHTVFRVNCSLCMCIVMSVFLFF